MISFFVHGVTFIFFCMCKRFCLFVCLFSGWAGSEGVSLQSAHTCFVIVIIIIIISCLLLQDCPRDPVTWLSLRVCWISWCFGLGWFFGKFSPPSRVSSAPHASVFVQTFCPVHPGCPASTTHITRQTGAVVLSVFGGRSGLEYTLEVMTQVKRREPPH